MDGYDIDIVGDAGGSRESRLLAEADRFSFRGRIDKKSATGPIFASATGSIVTDIDGRDYLDLNSGQMCSALGHNHPTVVAAIKEAADTMLHAHSSYYNLKEIELARRIAGIMPSTLTKSLREAQAMLTCGSSYIADGLAA